MPSTDNIYAAAAERAASRRSLPRAENSSLDLYYQPKYQASTLKFLGGEALLRWFHPERGQIPTADFIAVAEETGLIGDIGREGVLMQDAESGRRSLLALKEFGFALAVDDFGTGYCSLNYLKRFPLDTLKIDRSFVADISDDPDDAAIVRAIIALGHSLDLKIVAEGVTTQAQLKFLQAESCDAVQGYLMSPAVPASAFRDLWLRAGAAHEEGPAERVRNAG